MSNSILKLLNITGECMKLNRAAIYGVRRMSIRKLKCFLLFLIACNSSFCQSKISAKKGVLDLSNWNWSKDGITDLNGDWEFYWKALYTPSSFDTIKTGPPLYANVPGFWNRLIPGKK